MKQILVMMAAVMLVGCGTTSWVSDPSDENNVKIEAAIRQEINKPDGKLTKSDLESVLKLSFEDQRLTSVAGLERHTNLKVLYLYKNGLTNVAGLENFTNLEILGLEDTQLVNIDGLMKLTNLRRLNLVDNNQLSEAQVDELRKALPNCKIYGP